MTPETSEVQRSQRAFGIFIVSVLLVVMLGLLASSMFEDEKGDQADAYVRSCEALGGVAVEGPHHHFGCLDGAIKVVR